MKLLPIVAAVLVAAPAIAQQAPATGNRPTATKGAMQRGPMFSGMSEAGRATLFAAMRGTPEARSAAKAARDRISGLIAADTLDRTALKQAMEDERKLMDSQRARRQEAMFDAIGKLSTADRKAFAESTSRARARVEARTNDWRNRAMQHRNRPMAAPRSGTGS